MPRKKKEEVIAENNEITEAPVAEAATEEAPAPKKRGGRRKKADAEPVAEKVKEAVKKTVTRKPRKKAVVPNFVIQNSAEDSVTYESVVEKVQAEIKAADVSSIDIYVKAEEGKAYYVVNGEAASAVDLFGSL